MRHIPGKDWPKEMFKEQEVKLHNGEVVRMMLAEKRMKLSRKVNVREIRRLTQSDHQTAIITTDFIPDMTVIAGLKKQRKQIEKNIEIGELPECEQYSSLMNEKKHIVDTIKMIDYRAETAMAAMIQPKLSQRKTTRALLRQK